MGNLENDGEGVIRRRSGKPARRSVPVPSAAVRLLGTGGDPLPKRKPLEVMTWAPTVARDPATCWSCLEPIFVGDRCYRSTNNRGTLRRLCRWCGAALTDTTDRT